MGKKVFGVKVGWKRERPDTNDFKTFNLKGMKVKRKYSPFFNDSVWESSIAAVYEDNLKLRDKVMELNKKPELELSSTERAHIHFYNYLIKCNEFNKNERIWKKDPEKFFARREKFETENYQFWLRKNKIRRKRMKGPSFGIPLVTRYHKEFKGKIYAEETRNWEAIIEVGNRGFGFGTYWKPWVFGHFTIPAGVSRKMFFEEFKALMEVGDNILKTEQPLDSYSEKHFSGMRSKRLMLGKKISDDGGFRFYWLNNHGTWQEIGVFSWDDPPFTGYLKQLSGKYLKG